jgi:2,3-dihydroxybenzoate decarboxylase
MCSADPLACTLSALGHDRVMFAADYPFESLAEAAHFIDTAPIGEDVRNDICFNNAARIMQLQ